MDKDGEHLDGTTEEEEEEEEEEEKTDEKKQEEEMQRTREAFFAEAQTINWQKEGKEKVEPQLHINQPYPTKMPKSLPDGDDRFNKVKSDRVHVCDGCGALVSFSSRSRGTGDRVHGEFQGSWHDNSWVGNVDGSLLKQAYEMRLIDCRWYCTQFCGAPPSGVKDRMSRPASYRC